MSPPCSPPASPPPSPARPPPPWPLRPPAPAPPSPPPPPSAPSSRPRPWRRERVPGSCRPGRRWRAERPGEHALETVPSMVERLILAVGVVLGVWVHLVIVSAWHLVLCTSSQYRQQYIFVSLASDKCTNCKSLWIKALNDLNVKYQTFALNLSQCYKREETSTHTEN